MATQHATLTQERWAGFGIDRQILMIGNEMHRASKLLGAPDADGRRACYERVLNLADLTIAVNDGLTLRRELLRWRDLVAALFVSAGPDEPAHRAALRALLALRPAAWPQAQFVAPRRDRHGNP